MKAVRRRLLALGGGPAGVELAQVVRRLGGEAVIIEGAERMRLWAIGDVSGIYDVVLNALRMQIAHMPPPARPMAAQIANLPDEHPTEKP